jgi:hypothetical protein
MSQRVYISGSISILPYPEAVEKFRAAQEECMRLFPNAVIENPIAITGHMKQSEPWKAFMRECLKVLPFCTHIVMLPCWTESHGATLELQVARACGLQIIFSPIIEG